MNSEGKRPVGRCYPQYKKINIKMQELLIYKYKEKYYNNYFREVPEGIIINLNSSFSITKRTS